MHRNATCRVFTNSSAENYLSQRMNGAIIKHRTDLLAQVIDSETLVSHDAVSPFKKKKRKSSQHDEISRSDTDPLYLWDSNKITPLGGMPTPAFTVCPIFVCRPSNALSIWIARNPYCKFRAIYDNSSQRIKVHEKL